jgi:hypothetical protein
MTMLFQVRLFAAKLAQLVARLHVQISQAIRDKVEANVRKSSTKQQERRQIQSEYAVRAIVPRDLNQLWSKQTLVLACGEERGNELREITGPESDSKITDPEWTVF